MLAVVEFVGDNKPARRGAKDQHCVILRYGGPGAYLKTPMGQRSPGRVQVGL